MQRKIPLLESNFMLPPCGRSAGWGLCVRKVGLGVGSCALHNQFSERDRVEHVHRYVKPSGKCDGGSEILASHYALKGRTASGAVFDVHGNTAAARTWVLATVLHVRNPATGKSVSVTINDRGPYGTAYRVGARLDLALGAAQRIGMHLRNKCASRCRMRKTSGSRRKQNRPP
jgi:hypothetical protein